MAKTRTRKKMKLLFGVALVLVIIAETVVSQPRGSASDANFRHGSAEDQGLFWSIQSPANGFVASAGKSNTSLPAVFSSTTIRRMKPTTTTTTTPTTPARSVYTVGENSNVRRSITIGALFPFPGPGKASGWQGGRPCHYAVEMALADVNSHRDLLPNYQLDMIWRDTRCDPGLGVTRLYDLLYEEPTKTIILSGCSDVTTVVAEAAPMWNLVVVSYGSSSPALSDRKRFSTFFRTHPSAVLQNPSRIKLFQAMRWKSIAILLEASELFVSTAEDLEARCKKAKIDITHRQILQTGAVQEAVRTLQQIDARIIVGLFYEKTAIDVFCAAKKLGLYGDKVVWILIGWYSDNWYKNVETNHQSDYNCTASDLEEVVEGHLTTEPVFINRDREARTDVGRTAGQFESKLIAQFPAGKQEEGFVEAPLAYDAIWSIALALNRTAQKLQAQNKRIEDFTYERLDITAQLLDSLSATNFYGVSGHVTFSATGDRITLSQLEQMQNGSYKLIASDDFNSADLVWDEQPRWSGRLPRDQTLIVPTVQPISTLLQVIFTSVSAAGILLAVVCLVFNWMHRQRRIIVMSRTDINNIMLAGIMVLMLTIIILCLSGDVIGVNSYNWMCHIKSWGFAIGFSLAYGAMFSKIWRVHRITTKAKQESKKETDRVLGTRRTSFRTRSVAEVKHLSAMLQNDVQHGLYKPYWEKRVGGDSQKSTSTINTAVNARPSSSSKAPASRMSSSVSQLTSYSSSTSSGGEQLHQQQQQQQLNAAARFESMTNIQDIKSFSLYGVIASLVAVDVLTLLVWAIIDPLHRSTTLLDAEGEYNEVDDIRYVTYIESCSSEYYSVWMGFLFAYKAFVLIFGLFLSYETKNVKIKQINDSRFVGMSIYNVVVLSLITGPVMLIIKNQQDAAFSFVAFSTILCCYISMGLIFVPKAIDLYRRSKTDASSTLGGSTIGGSGVGGSGGAAGDGGPTEEEEQRYRALLAENESLKQQIADKEEKIKLLNVKLQERAAARARLTWQQQQAAAATSKENSKSASVPSTSGSGAPATRQMSTAAANSATAEFLASIATPQTTTAGAGRQTTSMRLMPLPHNDIDTTASVSASYNSSSTATNPTTTSGSTTNEDTAVRKEDQSNVAVSSSSGSSSKQTLTELNKKIQQTEPEAEDAKGTSKTAAKLQAKLVGAVKKNVKFA